MTYAFEKDVEARIWSYCSILMADKIGGGAGWKQLYEELPNPDRQIFHVAAGTSVKGICVVGVLREREVMA